MTDIRQMKAPGGRRWKADLLLGMPALGLLVFLFLHSRGARARGRA